MGGEKTVEYVLNLNFVLIGLWVNFLGTPLPE